MTISLKKIRAKLPKKMVRAADRKTKKLLKEKDLAGVRKLGGVTQEKLAKKMAIKQSTLSQFEKRKNIGLNTLREHVEALGGRLEIQVVFKEFTVPLHMKH